MDSESGALLDNEIKKAAVGWWALAIIDLVTGYGWSKYSEAEQSAIRRIMLLVTRRLRPHS